MKGMASLALFLVILAVLNPAMAVDQTIKTSLVEGAGIEGTATAFEKFKAVLGEVSNGNEPGPIRGGFRDINWDGAGVPFDMPGNFFRDVVTRGILFTVDGGEFRVSNPIMETDPGFGDDLFDTFNPDNPRQFQAFSEPRIFSPLTDYTFTEEFFIPGTGDSDPALISGYGAVFVDVDNKKETSIEFFDRFGESLGKFFAQASPEKISFLGVDFGVAIIAKVRVTLGNAPLGVDDVPKKQDVVVMDDFLFSEPIPIPRDEGGKFDP